MIYSKLIKQDNKENINPMNGHTNSPAFSVSQLNYRMSGVFAQSFDLGYAKVSRDKLQGILDIAGILRCRV